MGFAAWCSSEGDEPLVQWTPLGFAESVWQNYTEYTSNMFQFHWVFQALHADDVVSSSCVQNVLAGGMFFGQSLVRVFYPCLSFNLERFEACGAPCAKSQTRTSWSWSHLFDGWDPGILKKYKSHGCFMWFFLCIICQCAKLNEVFEDIAKFSGFRCSRLWHGGRVPPLQRRWVSGLQLHPAAAATSDVLGAKISGKCQGLLHSMRRPGWERWWIGEANCPFTIKRSLDWNAIHESLGKLLPFKLRKMEMMRLAQGTNAFWIFASQMQYALPAALWMVWILEPGLYTVKGQQTKLGEPTDVKSIEKMMSTKARHSGIGKTKNQLSIAMKLTLTGHDDHTSKPVLSYQFLTIHAAFFLHWNSSAQALAQSIPVLDISALYNGTKDKQRVIARRSVKQSAIEWVIFVSCNFLKMFNHFCSLIWRVTHHTSVE